VGRTLASSESVSTTGLVLAREGWTAGVVARGAADVLAAATVGAAARAGVDAVLRLWL
jgi:hypothetical protein